MLSSNFTIGCDPELMCRYNGNPISASEYFKANSSFGLDGCETTAEIRPGYSESPIDLTSKIYQVLEYGHEKAPGLDFYSGHYVDEHAIGGHTHFSIGLDLRVIDALDIVLGSFSNCIDDKQQKQKREKTGYGLKGAYRRKDHGFEYRTPGSFLLSPSITLVHLTLSRLTAIAVIEDNLNFKELKNHQRCCTFLKNLKHYFHTIPEDCKEGLKQLDMLIDKKPDWNQNILPNWGLAS